MTEVADRLFKNKPGRDGQPEPREPTEQEKRETSPERQRQIEKDAQRVPKRARPGNDNAKRKR